MKIEIKIEADTTEAVKLLMMLKTADNAKVVEWLMEIMPKEKKVNNIGMQP